MKLKTRLMLDLAIMILYIGDGVNWLINRLIDLHTLLTIVAEKIHHGALFKKMEL